MWRIYRNIVMAAYRNEKRAWRKGGVCRNGGERGRTMYLNISVSAAYQ